MYTVFEIGKKFIESKQKTLIQKKRFDEYKWHTSDER